MAVGEPDAEPQAFGASRSRQVAATLALLLLAASALYGGNAFSLRDRIEGSDLPALPPAEAREQTSPPDGIDTEGTQVRSQPWWQSVRTFRGDGPTTAASFLTDDGALQWRVTWSCERGRLVVTSGSGGDALVDAECPGSDTVYSTRLGPVALHVEADDVWQLQVDQQLEVPLEQAPLPAMTAPGAARVATGDFYRVEQTASGALSIYGLGDGTYALRLDEFFVTPNIDLEIHFSPLSEPRTTSEFVAAGSVMVAPLDVTAGSMNFSVPAEIDPLAYRSVVIWCPIIDTAYGAASLELNP